MPHVKYLPNADDSLTTMSLQVVYPEYNQAFSKKQLWEIHDAMERNMAYLYEFEDDQYIASKICRICRPQNLPGNSAVIKISFDA